MLKRRCPGSAFFFRVSSKPNMILNRQDAKNAKKIHFQRQKTWRSWRLGG
jgi:hypothetical protein